MKFLKQLLFLVLVGSSSVAPGSEALQEQAPLGSDLHPLRSFPKLGFGTWLLDTSNASEAVSLAIQTGYRHIDCAAAYGNEEEVGKGIKDGLEKVRGLRREELWITSKLWNDHHAPENVSKGLNGSLSRLGLDYLDLYLMHWPVSDSNGTKEIDYINTWKAMQKLPTSQVRHKGICNFSPSQFSKLVPIAKPAFHQMEMHPYLPQSDFLAWHQAYGIVVTAYSPLGNTNPTYTRTGSKVPALLKNPFIVALGNERNCTPAQVALEWGLARGVVVIPKAQRADHLVENFDVSAGAGEKCYPAISLDDVARIEDALPVKRFNNPGSGWGVKLFDGLQDSNSTSTVMDNVLIDAVLRWSQWIRAKAGVACAAWFKKLRS